MSAQGTGWICATVGRVVTCDHADHIDAGAASSFEVVTRVTAAAGVAITNTASVSATGREITTTNNESSANIVVPTQPTPPVDTTPAPPSSIVPSTPPAVGDQIIITPTTIATPNGNLPTTGGNPNMILQLAGTVLALGAILLVVKRRTNGSSSIG